MKKIFYLKRQVLLFTVIMLIAMVFSGCGLFQDKRDETTEPEVTAISVTVTLCLKDDRGQPVPEIEMTASDLPHEIAVLLGKTDENGLTQCQTRTGTQEVYFSLEGKTYKFERKIKESDSNQTITLQIVKENQLENENYKFARE